MPKLKVLRLLIKEFIKALMFIIKKMVLVSIIAMLEISMLANGRMENNMEMVFGSISWDKAIMVHGFRAKLMEWAVFLLKVRIS